MDSASRAALRAAREALEAGELETARAHCANAAAEDPRSADALGLAGEVEYRLGNPGEAESWLQKALSIEKRHARSHWILGGISQDAGRLDRAISSYRRALRADPSMAEAHNDLGTAYFAKGWQREAEECYRHALQLRPDNVAAMENLAAVLRAQGRVPEALGAFVRTLRLRILHAMRKLTAKRSARPRAGERSAAKDPLDTARALLAAREFEQARSELRRLLADQPENAAAHYCLGEALSAGGNSAEAIGHYRRAIELRASAPEYYVSLGNALTNAGRYEEALKNYEIALALDPGSAATSANIALVLHLLGHFREAESVYRLSLEHDSDMATVHCNRAATLLSLGKYAESESAARASLSLDPGSIPGHLALANALIEQRRPDEAYASAREAEGLGRENAEVLRWIGAFHAAFRGDLPAAQAYLERARKISPDNVGVHIFLARLLLIQQRFEDGWEEYEWRKREPMRTYVYTELPYPEWSGEPLEGKTILVNGEQGLGDEIMFSSCLQELASRSARCILLCSKRLHSLFQRSFPFAEVIGGTQRLDYDASRVPPGIDYKVAAGSLPRVFRRSVDAFPGHTGYLKADEGRKEKWRERVARLGPGIKIGLSWRGGTPLSDETRRTLRLADLERLIGLAGTHWVSLQFGDCGAEIASFHARSTALLHHWQEAIDDLDETAALMDVLDLRITVCNTQVHLSGALGREVWVLAPLFPDWRYGFSGERMLWYPAARVLRQTAAGDWRGPLSQLERDLSLRLQRR